MANATPESWLPVPGYEGFYEVSDLGRVKSLPRQTAKGFYGGCILKGGVAKSGHIFVSLCKRGYSRRWAVHQLVALAFIGPRPQGYETRHLNDIPSDNCVVNLAYGTSAENKQDALRNGKNYFANRTHCPKNHPYDDANTYWTPKGRRGCRACFNEKSKRRNRRQMAGEGDPCQTPGCDRGQVAQGLCVRCYARKSRAEQRGIAWYGRVCPQCGREFEVGPSGGRRKYCSDACAAVGRKAADAQRYQNRRAAA